MEFEINGKKHVLNGSSIEVELKTVSGKQLDKLLLHFLGCSLIQLCSLQLMENTKLHCFTNSVTLVTKEKVSEPVDKLLHKFASLFEDQPTYLYIGGMTI